MFWPPDSPWAPWWRTDKETALAICGLAKITSSDVIYDLGCGEAELLITAAKEYGAKGVGVEIDAIRIVTAKLRVFKNRVNNLIQIKSGNFFKQDLSKATVINLYLVPKTLEKLKPKFLKELSPGTRIVSYRYEMSLLKVKEDKKRKLFLYKI
jgi:ribosomal protein L11 methylase PrmA